MPILFCTVHVMSCFVYRGGSNRKSAALVAKIHGSPENINFTKF
jgi:hypothetical protein